MYKNVYDVAQDVDASFGNVNLCPLFTPSSHFYAISAHFFNCDSTVTQGYSVFSIYVLQYILQWLLLKCW